MPEIILIVFAAGLIYYVATRVAPKGLLFKLKKEEATSKKEQEDIDTAEDLAEEQSLIEKGQELFNQGSVTEAERYFLKAIKLNPKEPQAYHFLGMIYLRLKEYEGAAEVLKMAVGLNALNDTALNNLGLALYNLKKYEEAVEYFQKSIQLNDKIAHRFVNLGLAHQGVSDFEKAAMDFESAVRIHENVENLTLLAKNYLKLEDKKLGRKSLDRLLEIDPANTWAKRTVSALDN
jgi:Tfp pilus assembly protein PilF